MNRATTPIFLWAGVGTCLAVTLVLTSAGEARAQPSPATSTADSVALALKRGAAAAANNDFAACAAAYEEAARLAPKAATFGKLGLCEEQLGKYVAAFDHLYRAKESEPGAAQGGGTGLWNKVGEGLQRLRHHVARAIVTVSPAGAELLLDGVSLGKNASGRFFTIAPGEHTWTARLEGYETATFTHTVHAGDLPDVPLTLRFAEPLPPPPEPPCDSACQAEIREQGREEGRREAKARFEEQLEEEVQRQMAMLHPLPVDPGLTLFAGGLLSAGLTLDPGPGFLIGGDARWGAYNHPGFSAGLEARTLLPTRIIQFKNTVDVTQITVGVVPCFRYHWFAGCATVDAGMLVAGGQALAPGGDPFLFTMGLGPRLEVDFPFAERFGVRAFADVRFSPITDTGYLVGGKVWANPPVTGLFGLAFSFGQPVRVEP